MNWLEKKLKLFRFPIVLLVFFVSFFSGVFFISAYWAEFNFNISAINVTSGSLETSHTSFVVSHTEQFSNFEGETSYLIRHYYTCVEEDEYGNCLDESLNLCQYLDLIPQDGEIEEFGFSGQLNFPIDNTDTWDLEIKSPCFAGECPLDYSGGDSSTILKR